MPVRDFSAGGIVRAAIGAGGADTAAGAAQTYVALLKFAASEASQWVMARANAADSASGFTTLGREPELHFYPTGQDAGFTCPTNEWVIVVASKAAGITKANYHYYRFSTGLWASGESTNAFATLRGTVPDHFQFGCWNGLGSEPFKGRYAASAAFAAALSKAEAENLPKAASISAWTKLVVAPAAVWLFNQSSPEEPIQDITGGGANGTTQSGTTVANEEPPMPWFTPVPSIAMPPANRAARGLIFN